MSQVSYSTPISEWFVIPVERFVINNLCAKFAVLIFEGPLRQHERQRPVYKKEWFRSLTIIVNIIIL